jgi:hypothetical protein
LTGFKKLYIHMKKKWMKWLKIWEKL